jgi:hypothetical protein
MKRELMRGLCVTVLMLSSMVVATPAQNSRRLQPDAEFGPVVRAYLGYLRSEQEVVDDRASRREISSVYYRRNSNRIRALRQVAVRIARESHNDYLPELEAVTRDEFGSLFEKPPPPENFRAGEILNSTFRFLGTVRAGELFYIFARLDPYEQAELLQKSAPPAPAKPPASSNATKSASPSSPAAATTTTGETLPSSSRPRRVGAPH